MIKLYRWEDGRRHYWAAWEVKNRSAVIHWGIVGEQGETRTIRPDWFTSVQFLIEKEATAQRKRGFYEINEESMDLLVVEFKVDGWGSTEDIDHRTKIEQHLNQVLGWHGLGHVDGGSIGSGIMEVDCLVVDHGIAVRVVEQALRSSGLGEPSRIYHSGGGSEHDA